MRMASILSTAVCVSLSTLLILNTYFPSTVALADGLICKRECIGNYGAFCSRAKNYTSAGTTDIGKLVLYVERDMNNPDALSFASNIVDMGVESENGVRFPTKIVGFPEARDLLTVASNLSGDLSSKLNGDDFYETAKSIRDNITIVLNENAISPNGTIDFSFDGVKRVKVIESDSGQLIDAEILSGDRPPPSVVATLEGCCLKGRPPSALKQMKRALSATKFRPRSTRIVNLTLDAETEAAFLSSRVSKRLEKADPGKLNGKRLEELFSNNAGDTMVFLGHVENGRFVTKTPEGAIANQIEFSRLEELSVAHDVQLIYLGCRSADDLVSEWGSIGVAEAFRTADAVKKLELAFQKNGSVQDFLTSLSDNGFTIVVDRGAFENQKAMHADVVKRVGGDDIKIANIGYLTHSRWAFTVWLGDIIEYIFG